MRKLLVRSLVCLALLVALWAAGLVWFLSNIQTEQVELAEGKADTAVVLTGGSGRIEMGLRLLAEGHVQQLFISGAGKSVTLQDIMKKIPDSLRGELSQRAADIVLGHEAENTIGNAKEVAIWLEANPAQSIFVVTSNYHMQRAIEEMSHVLPGVTLIAMPVLADDVASNDWWLRTDSRQLILSEYHKLLAGKLRHYFLSLTA